MSSLDEVPSQKPTLRRMVEDGHVIVVSSAMFRFISYWRTAAVVLCDLASTAYYIGGIVEASVGAAAPWFILAVMLFSYAVRSVYIESCSLFVRGGVYRVVKEAMGGFLAKLSVSALMFDYVLTGPISGVSAGQYIMGLAVEIDNHYLPAAFHILPQHIKPFKDWGSVVLACIITVYFFRQNLLGIHESSGKALKIMYATTVMAVVILAWCGLTLAIHGPTNKVPLLPDFSAHPDPDTGQLQSPLGFLNRPPAIAPAPVAQALTHVDHELVALHTAPARSWLSVIGMLGILIAFGHSILAMSGEETLAQVYREVESPKLKNFKRAAFIVFVYSLVLTAGISFLAVIMIPDAQRMPIYSDNLIGGLAMNVIGPLWSRVLLRAFVVIIGFLILAGAVNTAIIGSNGVLNRVAEDGVLPDWLLKPHSKFGTTYRVLILVIVMQLFTILVSRGDLLVLGEAYAFGVVWSFVFKAMAMVVLRFRDRKPRDFMVPLNIKIGTVEFPLGLVLIFLVLLAAAIANLFTKNVATVWGLGFTIGFLLVFISSELYYERGRKGAHHEHREQFNRAETTNLTVEGLGLTGHPFRKLVAIRSPQNLFMLEKALNESDPATTSVIVMTAKSGPAHFFGPPEQDLDTYDQRLMTAVVERAEKSGKEVVPLIIPTNNPLYAVVRTAHDLQVQELIVGVSNKNTADEQLDQLALYWFNVCDSKPVPLTVRIVSRDREVHLDLAGGNRIPKLSEQKARSVAELRAAGLGVNRVLLAHDGTSTSHDLFQAVMTMLDAEVTLDLVAVPPPEVRDAASNGTGALVPDEQWAKKLGRETHVLPLNGSPGPAIVQLAREGHYDLIVVAFPEPWSESRRDERPIPWLGHVLEHSPCTVFVAAPAAIPTEVDEPAKQA
ncbi:MAG TPA: amino acid permease [Pirellulales bacterium]|jgi:amino acid transporter/nucleotide-binding universal stress UspA family protein|nr:amino acid permease [Pirellulales bacterium]